MSEQNKTDTTAGADNHEQQAQQQRIQTEERIDMDPSDMEEAIDQEHDQKVAHGDESRYEDGVDEALPDNVR